MAKPATVVAEDVASRARGLDLYLSRMEKLRGDGFLSDRDLERVYAGGFLEFHAYVERSIERVFLGLLRGRLQSSDRSVTPLIVVKADAVAIRVVTGERSYVDWLPYDRYTLRRGKSFFSGGRPFSTLEKADIESFDEASLIRNSLAHRSSSAARQFRKKLIEGRHIPPNQYRPETFLRGYHTKGQTRMSYYLSRLVISMKKLCK